MTPGFNINPTPQVLWQNIKLRKYNPLDREHYIPQYCWGNYCQRKKLRLFCMFRCAVKEDCQKSTKVGKRWFFIQLPLVVLNASIYGLHPNMGSLFGVLCIIFSMAFVVGTMFIATNKVLKAIDEKPVHNEDGGI